ncbi:hypothetical protein JCM18909_2568 [Cutibacterium acnes JCM 18909]|nr:hypothetical protein JCM18909_2568 [Cutibacterium acnes JCM 18909]
MSTLVIPTTAFSLFIIWNFRGSVVDPSAILVVGMVIVCAVAREPFSFGRGAPHCTRTYVVCLDEVSDGVLTVTTL